MNYLPIRRARPNQPNGEGIDWSNPITRGLKVAWMPAHQKNFANNRVLTPMIGSIVTKLTSRGLSFDLSGANKVEYAATKEEALVGVNEATMISIGKVVKPTGTSDTGTHFMFDLSVGYDQGYNSIAASGYANEASWQCSFYYASYAGTVTYYSPPFFVEGMEYSLAHTFRRNATACAYANGNLVSTKATLDYSLGRLQDGLHISNSLNGIHAILLNLAWDRELSPAEIKSIHDDPFQIFTRQKLALPQSAQQISAPIRRPRLNQPNGDGIDWSNPATKGLVFLSNASVPGVDMACPRTKMTTVGNVVSTASGNILTGDTVSSPDSRYYDVHNRKSFTVFGDAYLTEGGSVSAAYWNSYGWAMRVSHWSANKATFGIGGAWSGGGVAGNTVSWATNKPQPFAVTIDYQAMVVTLYVSGRVAGQWAMTGDLDPVQSTTPDTAYFRLQNNLNAGFSHVGVISGVSPFAKSLSINPGQVFL